MPVITLEVGSIAYIPIPISGAILSAEIPLQPAPVAVSIALLRLLILAVISLAEIPPVPAGEWIAIIPPLP
jgi:hypothetical protein